jgi:protein-tyrosine kinase
MSRIQDILSKAERDGTARRTRSLGDEYAPRPAEESRPQNTPGREAIQARGFVDTSLPRVVPAVPEPPRMSPSHNVADTAPFIPPDARRRLGERARIAPEIPTSEDTGNRPFGEATARGDAELDHHLVAALAPTSLAAEQYRSLRTRLKQAEGTKNVRSILITSPAKGDGKSLTAANLALTMAQEFQQRILVVDGDLRRPALHRLFGLADGPGLADALMNIAELDRALVSLPEYHVTVLPAGVPPSHPAELLGSSTMRRVLDTLRTRFDRILIDMPPVAPLADVHILAPMVDGLLMIVRAGITPKPAIERALSGLDQSKVLGLVLNESGGEATDGYNYEGYGYLAG